MKHPELAPHQAREPYDWAAILWLIQTEFAYMDGVIDPPSSMHMLTEDSIAQQAASGEVWVMGTPPLACVFLTPRPHALYIGKLAVATTHRGKGLARHLIDMADDRARAMALPTLELQTRVELRTNHDAFRAMGFVQTGETAHPGYARTTTLTFQRRVDAKDGGLHSDQRPFAM